MKSIEILSAILNEKTGFIEVVKSVTNDDNTIEFVGHSFHPETLEWWAATYGIDDKDELIDMILYEPYVENILPLSMTEEHAKTSQRDLVRDFKQNHKKDTTKSNAAKAIRESQVDNRYADAASTDPYEFIKSTCPFDDEVISVKKQHIDKIRNHESDQKNPRRPNPVNRKEALLRRLNNVGEGRDIKEKTIPKPPPTIMLEKGKRIR